MRTRNIIIGVAVAGIVLWFTLPYILIKFLPKGSTIETTDGEMIGG